MEMKKDRNKTLNEKAYHNIKQMIFNKNLGPGQKLVYKDLCQTLNMSPTPIIHSLCRLEQEGFLSSEPFRGFYIKPLDPQEAWDLYGVREALETYAIEQAIQQMDEKSMGILTKIAQKHEQYMPDYYDQKKIALDAEFHIQMAEISRNQALVKLLRRNLEHVYIRYRLQNTHPSRMIPAAEEHHKLLQRIKKKDIIGSIEIIRIHIRKARDTAIAELSKEHESINFGLL